jgi:NitT/TauT family transport system substrate-binding protein
MACSPGNEVKRDDTITVGMEATAVNSLIYIAQENKYFADNGIRVVIKDDYPSGAAATEGMLSGEVDIATTAELAIVRYAFAGTEVRTLGSIDMFMHMKLIGRKDRGITNISDLEGKRIGVPVKTAADFKLGRFLDLNNIDKARITIVDIQAPQALTSLMQGDVDAIVTWQPNVMDIEDQLGENAVVWEVQSGQPMYCVLMTTEKWVAEYPELGERFMKSLFLAENFLIENNEKARAIVQQRLGYDDRYIRTIWSEHQFSLRLDQSLILAMEDQARWMIDNGLTEERKVPDLLSYLHAGSLEAVKPEAVFLIR